MISILVLFFCQCRTTQLDVLKNTIRKSTSIKFLNLQEFNKSRELMLNTISPNVIENDSIIILEYFSDGVSGYYCTIYESKNKLCRRYFTDRSIKKGAIYIDSLRASNVNDEILPMIINGQLDEVKKRGDNSTLTPAASLIINIITKDANKKEFNKKTLVTQKFLPSPLGVAGRYVELKIKL